jgi:hypothetical protein
MSIVKYISIITNIYFGSGTGVVKLREDYADCVILRKYIFIWYTIPVTSRGSGQPKVGEQANNYGIISFCVAMLKFCINSPTFD